MHLQSEQIWFLFFILFLKTENVRKNYALYAFTITAQLQLIWHNFCKACFRVHIEKKKVDPDSQKAKADLSSYDEAINPLTLYSVHCNVYGVQQH